MPTVDRPNPRKFWITWGLATAILVLLAATIFISEKNRRLDDAQSRLETESTYLSHILQIELGDGDYELARVQVDAWGRLNKEATLVRLVTDNGFVLAEFRRDMPGAPTHGTTREFVFSYRGSASLRTEKSLEPVYGSIRTLAWQLVAALLVSELIVLALLHQFSRFREQVRLTQSEYERRLEAQHALERMATSDALTGLPNRYMLDEQLALRVAEATRFDRRLALLFIDIDNFKTINDSFGHDAGDSLLKAVAERLLTCLRSYDMLARFGGDEFVVLISNVSAVSEIEMVADKIIQALHPRIEIADRESFVSASIGVSLFPDDGDSPGELLRKADAAMYTAKEAGRNCFRFYTDSMNVSLAHRHSIETGLHEGLEKGQLYLVYQPQIEIATGRICSCEALLRWEMNGREIPPAEFIPVAEQSALMTRLQTFVIDTATDQRAEWLAAGIHDIRVDINVSGGKRVIGTVFEQIDDALQRHGLDSSDIGIELTEHTLIDASADILDGLSAIRARGITISLDDFGTGFSSLGYLKELPVDILKIDRSFVKDLPASTMDCAIVHAIIAMGKSMNKLTLIEGIETPGQLDFAREHGCDLGQGFLLYRPMPPDDIRRLLLNDPTYAPTSDAGGR